jgi:hypothetical protein
VGEEGEGVFGEAAFAGEGEADFRGHKSSLNKKALLDQECF